MQASPRASKKKPKAKSSKTPEAQPLPTIAGSPGKLLAVAVTEGDEVDEKIEYLVPRRGSIRVPPTAPIAIAVPAAAEPIVEAKEEEEIFLVPRRGSIKVPVDAPVAAAVRAVAEAEEEDEEDDDEQEDEDVDAVEDEDEPSGGAVLTAEVVEEGASDGVEFLVPRRGSIIVPLNAPTAIAVVEAKEEEEKADESKSAATKLTTLVGELRSLAATLEVGLQQARDAASADSLAMRIGAMEMELAARREFDTTFCETCLSRLIEAAEEATVAATTTSVAVPEEPARVALPPPEAVVVEEDLLAAAEETAMAVLASVSAAASATESIATNIDGNGSLIVPSGTVLGVTEGRGLCELLSKRSDLNTVCLSGCKVSAACLELIGEGLARTPSLIEELYMSGIEHTDEGTEGVATTASWRLAATIRALKSKNGLAVVDVSGQRNAQIDLTTILKPLCELTTTKGNQLKTLILGDNGVWADGAVTPLIEAMKSENCVIVEIDTKGGDLSAVDLAALQRKELAEPKPLPPPSTTTTKAEPPAAAAVEEMSEEAAQIAMLLQPLCAEISRAGNDVRTLKLGGLGGAWPVGASAPLIAAIKSPNCVLEELDVGGCDDADLSLFGEAMRGLRLLRDGVRVSEDGGFE